jgi:hypothetical protein
MRGKSRVAVVAACVLALAAAASGLWWWLRSSLQDEVYRTLERIERDAKGAVKVKAGDVSVEPVLRRATLRNVSVDLKSPQGNPITLHVDTLNVKKWTQLGDGSHLLREQALDWHGVTSPQLDAQLAHAPASVRKFTGDAPSFDLSHSTRYRPEHENELELDAAVSNARLGQVGLQLAMSGIDLKQLDQIARDQQAHGGQAALDPVLSSRMLPALGQTRLRSMRLVVRNAGVFEALVALSAAKDSLTWEQERHKLQAQLQHKCGTALADKWTRRLCPALTTFLENPKSLSLALAPATPVALSGVPMTALSGGPGAVMDQLGLTLVANQEP